MHLYKLMDFSFSKNSFSPREDMMDILEKILGEVLG